MEKVVVQTGAKTYQIADQDGNDLGVFRFIPSDAGILKRYKEAAAFFAGIKIQRNIRGICILFTLFHTCLFVQ